MAELPLPSPTIELEKFLISVENINSIHSYRNTQRFWPRKVEHDNLFKATSSLLHSDVSLVRDSSGVFVDYTEVKLGDVGLTAKNSTSLQRCPAAANLSVKGEPTNYPFWPGGFDAPTILEEVAEDGNVANSDLFSGKDLLVQAPGLPGGMTFSEQPVMPDSSNLDVSEILFGGGNVLVGLPDSSTKAPSQKTVENSKEDEIVQISSDSNEVLEGVLSATDEKPSVEQPLKAADSWAIFVDINQPLETVDNMVVEFPFTLDPFQRHAIYHLERHDNVFVAAHTSAGKTVVAEYAIAMSKDHHTRVIYTSPIKALSNQKFRDFRSRFGEDTVGLITGDVQIRTEAPCLIMTTEILRSMLYNGSDVIRDVEWVIFDEVHYISDSERGVVWEEVLIMLPDHVRIVMLSATVPNAMMFADWVGRTKKRKMYVVATTKRPVPLRHYIYTGNSKQTSNELFEIVNKKEIDKLSYAKALSAIKERSKKSTTQFGPKSRQFVNPKQERNIWLSLIGALQKKDKLPIIAFTFSRKRCDVNADSLSNLDLLANTAERSEVHVFFQRSMMRLKGSDSKLPQITWMRDLLKRGIAVHHSGILPILKEVIELLFQRGLVRLLFATETFAMGVNMPARTVIFDSNRKHDGIRVRDLNPGEYIQMAGRAGRRGLDEDGTVILLCKADVPELSDLKSMILGKPTSLESQFRLTYSMLLNLTRVETLKVKDMMKRSFAEVDSSKSEGHHVARLQELEKTLNSAGHLDCPKCADSIEQYYWKCSRIKELNCKAKMILSSPQVSKTLTPGRVLTIYLTKYKYLLAVVLKVMPRKGQDVNISVLFLCDAEDDKEAAAHGLVATTVEYLQDVHMFDPLRELYLPHPPAKHAVVEIPSQLVVSVTEEVMKVEERKISSDYNNRQIPRFWNNPPSSNCAKAVQDLFSLASRNTWNFTGHYIDLAKFKGMHLDIDDIETLGEKHKLEASMSSHECIECPQLQEHFAVVHERFSLEREMSNLKFMLSERSLQLLPDYEKKMTVLKRLSFLSDRGIITLKGRVACELHSQEVLVTELLFQNVLSCMEPAAIAALLSCVVFQQAKCSEPNLNDTLKEGKKSIMDVAMEIARVERECGLDSSDEDALSVLKFGLVEVVYEWARGKEFVEIVTLTDVSEGMIVRCIQRLDETCKDVRNAARVIGDSTLFSKMQTASTLIKRDIVFAASLYIQ